MSFAEPDEGIDPIEKSLKQGKGAAIVFTILSLIGLAVAWFSDAPFGGAPYLSQEERIGAALGILLEVVVGAIAIWRFHIGKGLFVGLAVFFLLLLEIAVRLADGAFGGVLMLGFLIWFIGKAVFAANEARKASHEDYEETFG